jgi:outer membrane protein OmpA-like peptidoglycan-associated protein
VDWWHSLEGGTIAEQRPPPPGSGDPYPYIASIPARPAAADIAAEQRIADQLAAQRDTAVALAAQNPVHPVTPPPKPPAPAAPDPNANKVVVDAAPAPPPVKAAAPAIPPVSSVPAMPAAITSGPLPELAVAPPPLATGIGDFVLPPAPPPPTPAAPVTVPNGVTIAFTPGSAELPPSATLNLYKFALGHKGAPLSVTGHGEAVLRNADAQSRAMDLAFKRVQAIATSLAAAGVPASSLRLHAEATGTGGSATLLN